MFLLLNQRGQLTVGLLYLTLKYVEANGGFTEQLKVNFSTFLASRHADLKEGDNTVKVQVLKPYYKGWAISQLTN